MVNTLVKETRDEHWLGKLVPYIILWSSQGEGVAYRGRLLMAVQAEFGESASESGIRQVEVEPTAPISDVSLQKLSTVTFWEQIRRTYQYFCSKADPMRENWI